MDFKDSFKQLVTSLSDLATAETFWQEIEKQYTAKGRHYHTLAHLQNMHESLLPFKESIASWDTLIFSIAYHDIVYTATAKDNEEKSAELALKRLQQLNFPQENINLCHEQIVATKHHEASANNDTNLLTDADLGILGASWPQYETYYKNVRKEYRIYPDFLYKPGRKKAISHFLEMENIFKTAAFRQEYEAAARANISREIEILTTL